MAEALQSSKLALQENQINIEEVELCMQELDDNIDALKRLDNALGKHPLSSVVLSMLKKSCFELYCAM